MIDENDWKTLLQRIEDGTCTPFLGAGASFGYVPLGSQIAQRWAKDHGFPFPGRSDLPKVAQFYSTQAPDVLSPKEELAREILSGKGPAFQDPDEPHTVLATLPLPIYMTTNYDTNMSEALRFHRREPSVRICKWNSYLRRRFKEPPDAVDMPTVANPLVFHLHGSAKIPESLVLTEDDYLDFLVSVNRDSSLLGERIEQALMGSTLLFVGYSLLDLTFRVIFRMLMYENERSWRRISISVQLPPRHRDPSFRQRAEDYLGQYFSRNMNVKIFWGDARNFAHELRQRWEQRSQ
jgi:hypothetical protein